MAACLDDSRSHGAGALCVDSHESQINTPPRKLMRLSCRSSNPSQSHRQSYRHGHAVEIESSSIGSRSSVKKRAKNHVWMTILKEASLDAEQEPILSQYYYANVLSHDSLESALANQLAVKLCNSSLSSDALYQVFLQALQEDDEHGNGIRDAVNDDLQACKERDPACLSYVHCFLNFKAFLSCQAQRIAHKFWVHDRKVLAVLIQNRVSEVFGVDIHPGARIGNGIVLDHATGVVIGETSVIGDNVTIFHNVTLGGTGKVAEERHPKIGDGVLIGAGAKVLGNIRVGEGAKIGAASVVLKEVPPRATVVGNPARLVTFRNRV